MADAPKKAAPKKAAPKRATKKAAPAPAPEYVWRIVPGVNRAGCARMVAALVAKGFEVVAPEDTIETGTLRPRDVVLRIEVGAWHALMEARLSRGREASRYRERVDHE